MITTAEAAEAILATLAAFDTESVSYQDATGRVLRQPVVAERDQPPFDRVTMDGIAIQHASIKGGRRRFSIQSRQHAGDPRQTLDKDSNCVEIMTGAMLPEGTDCVIPVERIAVENGFATIESDYEAERGQFIHLRGSDHRQDTGILREGHKLAPMDIAIIASCGLVNVDVSARPSISVISTGNELVEPGAPIEDHQIRMSNGPSVVALLQSHGFVDCQHAHLVDDRAKLRTSLADHLKSSDVLVLSGGVSMGKSDYVPEILQELGVTVVFHKISQRPGKPMWFGIGPDKQAVFALPGNPVSTLVCCRQYVIPALESASGAGRPVQEYAKLAEPYTFNADLTCFLPVRLSYEDGCAVATPVPTNTSGDFAALSTTDGYIELAMSQRDFEAGSVWPLHRW